MAREGNSSKNNKNCYITRGPEIVFEFVRKKAVACRKSRAWVSFVFCVYVMYQTIYQPNIPFFNYSTKGRSVFIVPLENVN